MKQRNIAIIAHVDHGKTTLVDQLLKKSGYYQEHETIAERAMDNGDIEKERGITILAKTTSIDYKDYKINILDTPGHADFGGEVERIMNMVDGALLVVDAYEGTMPQTRFVLKKAIEKNIKIIVVINKIDRPNARIDEVLDEVLELFIELGATNEMLEFKTVYASGLKGTSSLDSDPETQVENMDALFDMIIDEIPQPNVSKDGTLQFQPALLDYNDYVGRIGIGLVKRGSIEVNQNVSCVRVDGSIKQFRVQKILGFRGLERVELNEASAGDIVAISGLTDIAVGETVCNVGQEEPLPLLYVDEPTIQMTFGTNTSPMAGREGKHVTARKIEERLIKETQKDVSLRVERIDNSEQWVVSGRGELHLSILIETMRREGYELQVSKPKVIIREIDGVTCEPYESVQVDVPEEYVGSVIETLGDRKGIMLDMQQNDGQARLAYTMPSRGLIGFMTEFLTLTKGYGIINHSYLDYQPVVDSGVGARKAGVLVSMENGKATSYGLGALEDRGIMFIEPGQEVYEGMIVGQNSRDSDLAINVVKAKQLTNVRSAGKDNTTVLKKAKEMSLEACLEYINEDELVEVTPLNVRLRKRILNTNERKKFDKYQK